MLYNTYKMWQEVSTNNVNNGETICVPPGGLSTRRRKVDAIRRVVSLGKTWQVIIVSSINNGVPECKVSVGNTMGNMNQT